MVRTAYSELFGWWISSITFNIAFVIVASVYLYARKKRPRVAPPVGKVGRVIDDFAFVWILLALLILYVVSVGQASYFLFAFGNLAVEVVLIIYVVRTGRSQTQGNPA